MFLDFGRERGAQNYGVGQTQKGQGAALREGRKRSVGLPPGSGGAPSGLGSRWEAPRGPGLGLGGAVPRVPKGRNPRGATLAPGLVRGPRGGKEGGRLGWVKTGWPRRGVPRGSPGRGEEGEKGVRWAPGDGGQNSPGLRGGEKGVGRWGGEESPGWFARGGR